MQSAHFPFEALPAELRCEVYKCFIDEELRDVEPPFRFWLRNRIQEAVTHGEPSGMDPLSRPCLPYKISDIAQRNLPRLAIRTRQGRLGCRPDFTLVSKNIRAEFLDTMARRFADIMLRQNSLPELIRWGPWLSVLDPNILSSLTRIQVKTNRLLLYSEDPESDAEAYFVDLDVWISLDATTQKIDVTLSELNLRHKADYLPSRLGLNKRAQHYLQQELCSPKLVSRLGSDTWTGQQLASLAEVFTKNTVPLDCQEELMKDPRFNDQPPLPLHSKARCPDCWRFWAGQNSYHPLESNPFALVETPGLTHFWTDPSQPFHPEHHLWVSMVEEGLIDANLMFRVYPSRLVYRKFNGLLEVCEYRRIGSQEMLFSRGLYQCSTREVIAEGPALS